MQTAKPCITCAGSAFSTKHRNLFFFLLLVAVLGLAPEIAWAAVGAGTQTTPTQSIFKRILNNLTPGNNGGAAASTRREAESADGERLVPLDELKGPALDERIHGDLAAIALYRAGLTRTLDGIRRQREREAIRQGGQNFFDLCLGLEALSRYYDDFHRLRAGRRANAYCVRQAAFLVECRAALEFIALAGQDPALEAILNEPMPALGLPGGSYSRFKARFQQGAVRELAALAALNKTIGQGPSAEIRQVAAEDERRIHELGGGARFAVPAQEALALLQSGSQAAWARVPAAVAELGDPQPQRWGRPLVSAEQVAKLHRQLDPGDILLVRSERRIAGAGQPGFWAHAALYIGAPRERAGYFNESETKAWVIGQGHNDFESLLRTQGPETWTAATRALEDGQSPHLIEVVGETVAFTSLERAAAADAVAVLRPRLSKLEKAQAVLRACACFGRPFDEAMDFASDEALTCTELVCEAYEPGPQRRGLNLPLVNMMGRPMLTANELARQFDAGLGAPEQQLDLVVFLDGDERSGKTVEAGATEFGQSWRRPKWQVAAPAAMIPPASTPAGKPAGVQKTPLAWEVLAPENPEK